MALENTLKKELNRILKNISAQEGLEGEFNKSSFYKWEELRKSWFDSSQKYMKVKNLLFSVQIFLGSFPLILTIFVDEINNTWTKVSIWFIYALIVLFVNYLFRNFPDDYEKVLKDIKIIKLTSISEKLATQLALLDKTTNKIFNEDESKINKLSSRVKNFEEMSDKNREVITRCIQKKYRASDSRDTSIVFNREDIELSTAEEYELNKVTQEICEIAQILFGGKGFTAKLYLRVEKDVIYDNLEERTEILTSFSRFPTKDNFGTSWVKTRGKSSKVWDCLDKGESGVYLFEGKGLYYESILSVCLPGRIGILNIQNENIEIFKDKDIEINCKVISLYALERIEKILELH